MKSHVLLLPGIGNSGPEHWQSHWEEQFPNFHRVIQRDWDKPICAEWVAAVEQAVGESGTQTILVAHSLACLVVAEWAASTRLCIAGALLVAVPDPEGPNFPQEAVGFRRNTQRPFSFPSIVVASENDPYASLPYSQQCAAQWGSRFVNIGAAGHINASSNLGRWEEGLKLLKMLDTADSNVS